MVDTWDTFDVVGMVAISFISSILYFKLNVAHHFW